MSGDDRAVDVAAAAPAGRGRRAISIAWTVLLALGVYAAAYGVLRERWPHAAVTDRGDRILLFADDNTMDVLIYAVFQPAIHIDSWLTRTHFGLITGEPQVLGTPTPP